MEKTTLPPRNAVPLEETWNLENIFKHIEEWETAKDDVLSAVPELAKYNGAQNIRSPWLEARSSPAAP